MLRLDRRLFWGLALLLFSMMAAAAGTEVENPRLRLLPGDLPAAGYFSLVNTSEQPMVLIGAESPAFKRVTVHRSYVENGMAHMKHVARLSLKSGERVSFAPGGYHLMLMERTQPLAVGDKVTVTLEFEDGRRSSVVFRAVSPTSL